MKKDKRLPQVRIDEELLAMLEAGAGRLGISSSRFVRIAIEHELARSGIYRTLTDKPLEFIEQKYRAALKEGFNPGERASDESERIITLTIAISQDRADVSDMIERVDRELLREIDLDTEEDDPSSMGPYGQSDIDEDNLETWQ